MKMILLFYFFQSPCVYVNLLTYVSVCLPASFSLCLSLSHPLPFSLLTLYLSIHLPPHLSPSLPSRYRHPHRLNFLHLLLHLLFLLLLPLSLSPYVLLSIPVETPWRDENICFENSNIKGGRREGTPWHRDKETKEEGDGRRENLEAPKNIRPRIKWEKVKNEGNWRREEKDGCRKGMDGGRVEDRLSLTNWQEIWG